jgi:hypothetical protein
MVLLPHGGGGIHQNTFFLSFVFLASSTIYIHHGLDSTHQTGIAVSSLVFTAKSLQSLRYLPINPFLPNLPNIPHPLHPPRNSWVVVLHSPPPILPRVASPSSSTHQLALIASSSSNLVYSAFQSKVKPKIFQWRTSLLTRPTLHPLSLFPPPPPPPLW